MTTIILLLVVYSIGWHVGRRRCFIYIGTDEIKYANATIGVLLTPK